MGSDLHSTQLIRQTSTFTVGGNQSIVRTYSLHIRVRTFTAFGDEAVDPRGDNGQRHGAEFEHGIVESAEPRSSNARSRAAFKTTTVANDVS
jgi:hypothetical protein